jgi:hypothetical protein
MLFTCVSYQTVLQRAISRACAQASRLFCTVVVPTPDLTPTSRSQVYAQLLLESLIIQDLLFFIIMNIHFHLLWVAHGFISSEPPELRRQWQGTLIISALLLPSGCSKAQLVDLTVALAELILAYA